MHTKSSPRPFPLSVKCKKCDHENSIDTLRCEECASHLYVSCKHCGVLNVRTENRCEECRTQLHQRGKNMWQRAKARKWIRPLSYALVSVASALTFYGIVKISEYDFRKIASEPIYIAVDGETLNELQSN